MTERYWFRPKSFDYGANPITWEGWAVTFGSAIVTLGAVLTIVFAQAQHWPDRRPLQGACLVEFVAALIVTIVISRYKTDGHWHWRP